ncbi:MAG: putative quinol monooxygenase [Bellilinea sp.]
MHIVLVHIHVKPEFREAFIQATLENAQNSIQEEGIARFDFLQQKEDLNRFTLIEVYYAESDQEKHRQTAHYLKWREAVAEMMAEPRQGVQYSNIFPGEGAW